MSKTTAQLVDGYELSQIISPETSKSVSLKVSVDKILTSAEKLEFQ